MRYYRKAVRAINHLTAEELSQLCSYAKRLEHDRALEEQKRRQAKEDKWQERRTCKAIDIVSELNAENLKQIAEYAVTLRDNKMSLRMDL